jgi:hypothetical protein
MPVVSSAATGIRSSGASVTSVVNTQTVTEAVASRRSSWMMTTGRGLSAYPLPAAAVQMSPRFTRRASLVVAECVDEGLIGDFAGAVGNGERLVVCLLCELG